MASRHAAAAAGALGAGALLWWALKNKATATVPDAGFGQAYDPYLHFLHQSPAGWVRHYPAQAGTSCLPMPYQTQDVGLAVKRPEVSSDYADAACAQ